VEQENPLRCTWDIWFRILETFKFGSIHIPIGSSRDINDVCGGWFSKQ